MSDFWRVYKARYASISQLSLRVARDDAQLGPLVAALTDEQLAAQQADGLARTERAIATFSTVQVRDPVQLGEPRSERFAEHLAPLMSALEQAGVDPITGSFASDSEPKP